VPTGGTTLLGVANRGNPYACKTVRDGREATTGISDEIIKGIKRIEMDALPVLGGDGTLTVPIGCF
jgi:6-phosphofructokinase 1